MASKKETEVSEAREQAGRQRICQSRSIYGTRELEQQNTVSSKGLRA